MLKQERKWVPLLELVERVKVEYYKNKLGIEDLSDARKSEIVHSVLLNVPVEQIVVLRIGEEREVISGHCILYSIYQFYRGVFAFNLDQSDSDRWSDLNGTYYRHLPPKIMRRLDKRRLEVVEVLIPDKFKISPEIVRQIMIKRLNGERYDHF